MFYTNNGTVLIQDYLKPMKHGEIFMKNTKWNANLEYIYVKNAHRNK